MKFDTMNKTIELYYKKEVEFIATLEKHKKGFLVLPNDTIKELECSLENRGNEYLAKFDYLAELDNEFGRSVKEIIFRNEEDNFVLENMYLDSTDYTKAEGSINSLRSESFNENKIQYYKAIIPVSKKISFYSVLERESFKCDFNKVIGNTIIIHYKDEVFIVSSNEIDNVRP